VTEINEDIISAAVWSDYVWYTDVLWQVYGRILPWFCQVLLLGCHVLGEVLGKVWTCSGQCWRYWDMARTWKKYGKNRALARVAFCHFSRCL